MPRLVAVQSIGQHGTERAVSGREGARAGLVDEVAACGKQIEVCRKSVCESLAHRMRHEGVVFR